MKNIFVQITLLFFLFFGIKTKIQAQEISDSLAKDGVNISHRSELIALIAYMQKLGREVKLMNKEQLQEMQNNN